MTTIAKTQIRSSWQIMKSSIYALMIRNLEQRFIMESSSKRSLDLLIIFLEPAGHVLFWITIKMFRYQGLDGGGTLSPAHFVMLGVIPWLLTYNFLDNCIDIVVKHRTLFFFRQIKLLDPVIALLLSELETMALIFIGGLLILSLFGIDWLLQDPLRWLMATLSYIIFLLGVGILFTMVGFFSKNIAKFFRVLLRFGYLLSGVFFSAQMLPAEFRSYFILNPIFQIIEISRGCFSDISSYSVYANIDYLFKCAVVSITIGLGSYALLRRKMMMEIMEH